MKHDKSTKSEAGESAVVPTKSRLVLKRRPVASLSEEQLSDAVGGHPHPKTCEPTCPATCAPTCPLTCGHSCRGTCDEGYTCSNECPVP